MLLQKYSFGTGDRFGQQGAAQLQAVSKAKEAGVDIAIVWNKSHREHLLVKTNQSDVRREADEAVKNAGWSGSYYVDADHINLSNVDGFLPYSDFFTIDVADFIGEKAAAADLSSFVTKFSSFIGNLDIAGIDESLHINEDKLGAIAEKYLFAVQKAAEIYRYIASQKGEHNFITEVSMDETADPQTPDELFFILAALADYNVPVQTIAPKFTGRFNKGVDYQGDVEQFNGEFNDDICVISHAVSTFNLPQNLKLSVHSGSDKFSIYPGIRRALERHNCGIHVKTAGTTWLEELIGLAESGGDELALVKSIYQKALERSAELSGPYSTVIDIDTQKLPTTEQFSTWDSGQVARSIRHDQSCPDYNPNIRQLLHIGFKIAAELGDTYITAVRNSETEIAKHVCENLFERHIRPLFL